jgi:hypothetical protein
VVDHFFGVLQVAASQDYMLAKSMPQIMVSRNDIIMTICEIISIFIYGITATQNREEKK